MTDATEVRRWDWYQPSNGHDLVPTKDGPWVLHGEITAHHASEIAALKAENAALRNLANNLQPGPISEALAGTRYERESALESQLSAALQRAEQARVAHVDYLQMPIEQYPSAQSLGGTYLSVLLKEKIAMLNDAALPKEGEG